MSPLRKALALVLFAALAPDGAAQSQDDGFDSDQLALAYHRLTGQPLDLRRIAEQSEAVRSASSFDGPEVLRMEIARLEALLANSDPAREWTVRVNDHITDYDHDRSQFYIMLFQPGYHIPFFAFDQD